MEGETERETEEFLTVRVLEGIGTPPKRGVAANYEVGVGM